jgi:N-acyl-D-aspartate/D-glutamate deacylase
MLLEGAPADIVIYDLEKLAVKPIEILQDLPGDEWRRVQRADGYKWMIVNGQVTFDGDRCTGATPGKLLRHGM